MTRDECQAMRARAEGLAPIFPVARDALALLDALEAVEQYGVEMRDAARDWRERFIASERQLQERTVERDRYRGMVLGGRMALRDSP